MQDLRLVGVHDDGEHVVLVDGDGGRFRLRVDEALRAAVRRDRARLGQLQIQLGAQLRPRDIQARIRAGASAEEVADAGGLAVEHVRRYEGPVLAERAHISGLARRTTFGRGPATGPLEDVVLARLTARAVDPDGVRWDSWRVEDGSWTVQVEFVAGGRSRIARWSFDHVARTLLASDDEARWLSEEAAEPGPLPPRRLVSIGSDGVSGGSGGVPVTGGPHPVGERVYDVEADGGVLTARGGKANDDRRRDDHRRDDHQRSEDHRTEDLLDALDARRGVRGPLPTDDDDQNTGAAVLDALLADPPAAHPPASAPQERLDDTVLPAPATVQARPADDVAEDSGTAASPQDGTAPPQNQTAAPTQNQNAAPPPGEETPAARRRNRSARRAGGAAAGKRSSVPPWDDIMFGAKKD